MNEKQALVSIAKSMERIAKVMEKMLKLIQNEKILKLMEEEV